MTAPPDLGGWLRQQREQRSWTRTELARRLIKVAQVSGDTAMPAAEDVAANIYRWERGTVSPPTVTGSTTATAWASRPTASAAPAGTPPRTSPGSSSPSACPKAPTPSSGSPAPKPCRH
jgi:hypothetical protein